MTLYDQYVDSIEEGAVASKYAMLAVKRYLSDLEKSKNDDSPYYFDRDTADWAIGRIMSLKHTSSAFYGKPFNLQPFQAFIIANVFGWLKKENGLRRFDKLFISMARKNGKSELMAAIMVLLFMFDGEARANVFSAATDEAQAKECFIPAQIMIELMIEQFPFLKKMVNVNSVGISKSDHSTMRALTRAKDGKFDGKNIHCAVIDEYHAHKNSDLLDVLESSTGSRPQPLICVISTAGFNPDSPCLESENVYKKVLTGDLEEERTFCILFVPEEIENTYISANDTGLAVTEIVEIDYSSRDIWLKANPNLGVSLYEDNFASAFIKAKNAGGRKWVEFLTKKLNIWSSTHSMWLPADIINANKGNFTLADLEGRDCFGGLDLASVYDLNSFKLFFPSQSPGEPHRVLGWNFMGRDNLTARVGEDYIHHYRRWAKAGHLRLTNGTSTDYNVIEYVIKELANRVNIVEIAYDPFQANQIVTNLIDYGLDCYKFRQGYLTMSEPTKRIDILYRNVITQQKIDIIQGCNVTPSEYGHVFREYSHVFESVTEIEQLMKFVNEGNHVERIQHNGDPVSTWAFSNVVMSVDPAGNWKVNKDKSKQKVDPVVAEIMALGQWMDWYTREHLMSMGVGAAVF